MATKKITVEISEDDYGAVHRMCACHAMTGCMGTDAAVLFATIVVMAMAKGIESVTVRLTPERGRSGE